jgi:hypothetical protein
MQLSLETENELKRLKLVPRKMSLETENELKRLKLVPRKMFSNERPGAGSKSNNQIINACAHLTHDFRLGQAAYSLATRWP